MSDLRREGVWLNLGLIIPLVGIFLAYLLILITTYVEMTVIAAIQASDMDQFNSRNYLHPYTYLLLLAITVLVVTSLIGRNIVAKKRASDPSLRIHRNVYTFTTITIMTSLIASAIYALAIYFTNQGINRNEVEDDPMLRLLQLYIPIVLVAALMVVGILRAFVMKPKGVAQ